MLLLIKKDPFALQQRDPQINLHPTCHKLTVTDFLATTVRILLLIRPSLLNSVKSNASAISPFNKFTALTEAPLFTDVDCDLFY